MYKVYLLVVTSILCSCESKWPNEIDCYCLLPDGLARIRVTEDCEEIGGSIVTCNMHDYIDNQT